jgi:hypothetical protein
MALSPRAIDAMKAHAARGGPEGDIAARKLAAMGIPVGGGASSGGARVGTSSGARAGGGGGGGNMVRHYPKPGNRVALPAGGSSAPARRPMLALPSGGGGGGTRRPMLALPSGGGGGGGRITKPPKPPKPPGKKVVDDALKGADDLGKAAGNAAEKAVKQKNIFKGHGKGLLIGAGAAVVAGLAMNRRGSGTSSGRAGMTRY